MTSHLAKIIPCDVLETWSNTVVDLVILWFSIYVYLYICIYNTNGLQENDQTLYVSINNNSNNCNNLPTFAVFLLNPFDCKIVW